MMNTTSIRASFVEDVRKGLSGYPKTLPSKYFYDKKGDELFQRIMALEEYYPTAAEHAILSKRADGIARDIAPNREPFSLIELGAGDGKKTKDLLNHLSEGNRAPFRYFPNDISFSILDGLSTDLRYELPDLEVEGLPGDYFEVLGRIKDDVDGKKVILFLGGNIGNYDEVEALELLQRIRETMDEGDRLMIGFDLKKDPARILKAYNDPHGVTRDFNLNLLERINRELGGDIDVDGFIHYPIYDPLKGEARSYLVSKREQRAKIQEADLEVHFSAWEAIFTERSRKFDPQGIRKLAEETGFKVVRDHTDPNGDFVDSIWEVD